MNQERKPLSLTRKIQFTLFIVFVVMLGTILLGEVVMRLTHKGLTPPYNNKAHDKVLGWKSKGGYHAHLDSFLNKSGGTYTLDVHFAPNGYRMWSETVSDSSTEKLLFIGDSYTESLECPDKQLFYGVVRDSLPCTVYACGTAGYGTTQELLILQQYIDTIKPNRVILEVCNNDFVDNDWNLEKRCNYIVGQTRPYLLLNDKIEYHYPRSWFEHVKEYSLFLNYIFGHGYTIALALNMAERDRPFEEIVADSANFNFKNTIALTENALRKINETVEAHGAMLYVFDADRYEPGRTIFSELCKKNNIAYITGVADEISNREMAGDTVHAYDGYHWNGLGEQIVGQQLVSYFRQHPLSH